MNILIWLSCVNRYHCMCRFFAAFSPLFCHFSTSFFVYFRCKNITPLTPTIATIMTVIKTIMMVVTKTTTATMTTRNTTIITTITTTKTTSTKTTIPSLSPSPLRLREALFEWQKRVGELTGNQGLESLSSTALKRLVTLQQIGLDRAQNALNTMQLQKKNAPSY